MPRVFLRGTQKPKKRRILAPPSAGRAVKRSPEMQADLLQSQLAAVVEGHPAHMNRPSLDQPVLSERVDDVKGKASLRKPIAIRFTTHEKSPHVLQTPTRVKKIAVIPRVAETAHIRRWVAPFQTPNVDRIAEARGLHVASVDPRCLLSSLRRIRGCL